MLLHTSSAVTASTTLLLGSTTVDLVFDLHSDREVTQAYYRALLNSPVHVGIKPLLFGITALGALRSLWHRKAWCHILFALVLALACCEFAVQPALVKLQTDEADSKSEFDAKSIVRSGHFFMAITLSLVIIMLSIESRKSPAQHVVEAFLKAQDKRDLDLMCSMVAEDITYINEPHEEKRHIRSKTMFRKAFQGSPCIWAEKAHLEVRRMSCDGDTVYLERLDQFLIDGKWLTIPILGYIVVENGKVKYWKDYWCYKKYKEQTTQKFGPDFSLFKATKTN